MLKPNRAYGLGRAAAGKHSGDGVPGRRPGGQGSLRAVLHSDGLRGDEVWRVAHGPRVKKQVVNVAQRGGMCVAMIGRPPAHGP